MTRFSFGIGIERMKWKTIQVGFINDEIDRRAEAAVETQAGHLLAPQDTLERILSTKIGQRVDTSALKSAIYLDQILNASRRGRGLPWRPEDIGAANSEGSIQTSTTVSPEGDVWIEQSARTNPDFPLRYIGYRKLGHGKARVIVNFQEPKTKWPAENQQYSLLLVSGRLRGVTRGDGQTVEIGRDGRVIRQYIVETMDHDWTAIFPLTRRTGRIFHTPTKANRNSSPTTDGPIPTATTIHEDEEIAGIFPDPHAFLQTMPNELKGFREDERWSAEQEAHEMNNAFKFIRTIAEAHLIDSGVILPDNAMSYYTWGTFLRPGSFDDEDGDTKVLRTAFDTFQEFRLTHPQAFQYLLEASILERVIEFATRTSGLSQRPLIDTVEPKYRGQVQKLAAELTETEQERVSQERRRVLQYFLDLMVQKGVDTRIIKS